jgi:hypothetical protein
MPQLNFTIPESLLAKIDAAVPEYLDRKGFLCLLIDQALDSSGTLGATSKAGAPSSTLLHRVDTCIKDSRKKNVYTYIDISGLIDQELVFCSQQLIDWWALRRKQHGKQAIGTEQAWNASQNALKAILRVHGRKVVEDTVTAALANGWRGIRESYAVLPSGGRPSDPLDVPKHPASRLFQNGRFVDEDGPTTNPALQGLF